MATVDPYRLLQVHPEADAEIIQVAYRKLAQRHHPDVAAGPEAARRMAELNAARDLLLDPVARAAYDREHRRTGPAAHGGASAASTPAEGSSERASAAHEPAAGPPPGSPSGSVLTFGRYAGWSLGEISRRDVEYVEWLDRMPIGRPYRAEIDAILRRTGRRGGAAKVEEPHGLFRRR
ncbi:MAG: J domain-containing protein [Chloroflexi bacterium]|jgi:curved DNA-binding protein CbpA|nr:J domain-containing protein [Chloroflexota bacterium]